MPWSCNSNVFNVFLCRFMCVFMNTCMRNVQYCNSCVMSGYLFNTHCCLLSRLIWFSKFLLLLSIYYHSCVTCIERVEFDTRVAQSPVNKCDTLPQLEIIATIKTYVDRK